MRTEEKEEQDLVGKGVYVVFWSERNQVVLQYRGWVGGERCIVTFGSSIKSRASMGEEGMRDTTARSAAEMVWCSPNKYTLEAGCWSENVGLHHKDF